MTSESSVNAPPSKPKKRSLEQRILVRWIRFARRHRSSEKLPFYLAGFVFLDAFVLFVPSTLLTALAVTISPKRWLTFVFSFCLAIFLANFTFYLVGRVLPPEQLLEFIQFLKLESLWDSAADAVRNYGAYATFIGSLLGLPTQYVMALIGISDSQALFLGDLERPSVIAALTLLFLGHLIKIGLFCLLVQKGWMKIERKYSQT